MADFTKRIVFLGNEEAGKTSLMKCLQEKKFESKYQKTIGVDYASLVLDYDKYKVRLNLWDTSGANRFKSITSSYCMDTDLFVYVVDSSQPLTSAVAGKIASDIENYYLAQARPGATPVPILLVASKQDLAEQKGVDVNQFLEDAAQRVAQINPIIHFRKKYAISATTPLSSNLMAQTLKNDLLRITMEAEPLANAIGQKAVAAKARSQGNAESATELLPMWWIEAHKTLQTSLKNLSKNKKHLVDNEIAQLKKSLLSDSTIDTPVLAVSHFTQKCDDILQVKHPVAKRALYVFALTVLCSLIALSIAMSFGISGIALLAAATVAGGVLGAGTGLLTKNSLFKPPACLTDIAQFATTVEDNVNPGVLI